MSTRRSGPTSAEGAVCDISAGVGEVLLDYQTRGVLQHVADPVLTPQGAEYRIVWSGRPLRMVLHRERAAVAFPELLPAIPADSAMYHDLQSFVRAIRSPTRAAHRRIDPEKAGVSCRNFGGDVTVSTVARDGSFVYATRQLLSIVHEIFTGFLADGLYSDYEYEHFGVSPWI